MKSYTAAPPDVLRVDEKNLREHSVMNCCGVIITTNYKSDGIYLPADDRRHFVAWSDLTKDDFAIEEDAHPQTIRYFSRETDLPLTLGLLVDVSLSQRRVLGEERRASTAFLNQVLREDKDRAFLIQFERDVELIKDLTSSRKDLESGVNSLDAPELKRPGDDSGSRSAGGRRGGGGRGGGGTSLYDAVYLASDEVLKKQPGRKAVIVLSDGDDRTSKTSLTGAIESAQRADTLVYSILFEDPEMYGGGIVLVGQEGLLGPGQRADCRSSSGAVSCRSSAPAWRRCRRSPCSIAGSRW